ncbi:MAG: PDZ domain-containing protein [Candidatus Tectomicrobia bacterium]|nr:PDZ domain-containing protein [Candidatus Tectomicrobia bacterium]
MKLLEVAKKRASRIRAVEMESVLAPVERMWNALVDRAEALMQKVQLPVFHLPAVIAFALLTFGAGWVAGLWAARPSPTKETSPLLKNLPPNYDSLPPGNSIPTQQQGESGGRAYLGIRGKAFHQDGRQGVKILEVFQNSPAAKAGLRSDPGPGSANGHIIVGAHKRAIRSEADLSQLLALSSPGSLVQFLVTSSDGNSYELIPVILGSIPEVSPVSEPPAKNKIQSLSAQDQNLPLRGERSLKGERWVRGIEEEIFRAVNRAREEEGLPSLKENPHLQRVARRHSEDMATRHFFDHFNSEGWDVVDRLRAENIKGFTAAGENIFSGKSVVDPAQVAVREWLKSPSHRRNLLNPRYIEGGTGIAWGDQNTIYITQVYLER